MAGDEENDDVREAREARVAAQRGSVKRLLRRVVLISIMSVASLYLCAMERGTSSSSSSSWHPPLSVASLYRTLVVNYSFSSGLLDVACLTAVQVVYVVVVYWAATPCDRRRALLKNVRLARNYRDS